MKTLLSPFALLLLVLTTGCIVRTTPPVTAQAQQPVIVQQQPIVIQQPAPVVVHQPAPVVVRSPSPVLTPVRVSVPARPVGSVSSGVISYPYQRMRYPLTLTYTRTTQIYVDGYDLDPTVTVYNSSGSQIAFNDDGGQGLDSQLTVTLSPGSYVIEVAGWRTSTGSYTLTVN